MLPVTMACVFALAMTICSKGFAATQFAIYMSIANLGASAGSKAFGLVVERASYVQNYVVLGLFVVAMLFFTLGHQDVTLQEDVAQMFLDWSGQWSEGLARVLRIARQDGLLQF